MKPLFLMVVCAASLSAMGQDSKTTSVLQLSERVFQWEVVGKMDSLQVVLDDRLLVVGSDGSTQSKDQYLQRLTDGNFVHNNIAVEESKATVADNTAVVVGKGKFTVTVSGTKSTRHLAYMEVFARPDTHAPWKLLAIKANVLPD